MKKIICIFTAVCLLSLGITMAVFADEAALISADNTIECLPGAQNVAVTLTMQENPGIAVFLITMGFDNTKITPTGTVEYGYDVFDEGGFESNVTEPGKNLAELDNVNVLFSHTSNTSVTGSIATFYFNVANDVPAGTEIPLVLSTVASDNKDQDSNVVPVNLSNGKITVKGEIDGYTFADDSAVYDGTEKSIDVTGLPAGVSAAYSYEKLNEATSEYETVASCVDVGTYRVTAHMTGAAYFPKDDTATLTITPATITGYTFENSTVTYNGTVQNIAVTAGAGATEGVDIAYTCNGTTFSGAADVGTYEVTATIAKANYNDTVLTATLTIEAADITGYSFDDLEVDFDGTVKNIEVAAAAGATEGADIAYTCNGAAFAGAADVGTYEVTATITKANYNDLVLTATLTINESAIAGYTFSDDTVVYDGNSHTIAVTAAAGATDGVTIAYTSNGETFTGATNAGTYPVTATISKDGYGSIMLSASLVITPAPGEQNPAYIADAVFPYTYTVDSITGSEKTGDIDLAGTGFAFVDDAAALALGNNTVYVNYTSADPNYSNVENAEKVVILKSRRLLDYYDLRFEDDDAQWYSVDANNVSEAKTMTGVKYYINNVEQDDLPAGITVTYSRDGVNYGAAPVVYEGGTYTVYAKISADGFSDTDLTANFKLNYVVGDVNTDNAVDGIDITTITQKIVGWSINLTETQYKAGRRVSEPYDDNPSSPARGINTGDLLTLLQKIANWPGIVFGPAD